jgi:hypothetical protein
MKPADRAGWREQARSGKQSRRWLFLKAAGMCAFIALCFVGYSFRAQILLSWAVRHNDNAAVDTALRMGADANGDCEDYHWLLRDPTRVLDLRHCPLICAATEQAYLTHDTTTLERLLRAGANPNAQDSDGRYPLNYCYVLETRPDRAIIGLLVRYGAKPVNESDALTVQKMRER